MTDSRTVIYYLSGAGNSLRFARRLAARMEGTSLIPLAQATGGMPTPAADRIGIVFPVIMMGIPAIVSRFLKRVPADKDTYFFAVAANGGMMAGSLNQVAGILRARGLRLSAGFSVIMHRLAADPQAFDARLAEVASAVDRKLVSPFPRGSLKDRLILTGIGNRLVRLMLPRMDRGFRVNGRCDGCGVCAKVCPVQNISLTDGKPVWKHHCEQCLACLHWCPRAGLDYGKKTETWLHKCPGMELTEYLGEGPITP